MRILVVDDEPRLAKSLARLLESHGHEPTIASDGLEAWGLFEAQIEAQTQAWDLLITDIRMPKLDGISLARRVRAAGSSIPVVFISGHGELPSIGELLPASFLAKPFKQAALLAVMQSSVD